MFIEAGAKNNEFEIIHAEILIKFWTYLEEPGLVRSDLIQQRPLGFHRRELLCRVDRFAVLLDVDLQAGERG